MFRLESDAVVRFIQIFPNYLLLEIWFMTFDLNF